MGRTSASWHHKGSFYTFKDQSIVFVGRISIPTAQGSSYKERVGSNPQHMQCTRGLSYLLKPLVHCMCCNKKGDQISCLKNGVGVFYPSSTQYGIYCKRKVYDKPSYLCSLDEKINILIASQSLFILNGLKGIFLVSVLCN